MKISNHENFVVLEDEKNNIGEFASFLEYQITKKYKGQNVVINLAENHNITLDELLHFLNVSNLHRATNHSFIFVNDAINPDELPAELIVVPSLQEAVDIIEMEEIERNLGF